MTKLELESLVDNTFSNNRNPLTRGGEANTLIKELITAIFDYKRPTISKSTNYTVLLTDFTIRVNCTSGNKNITLPDATTNLGQVVNIKKIDSSLYIVNIIAYGTQLIDGVSTKTIDKQYSSLQLQSNGTGWDIL
jgi:hypothetical protein